MTYRLSRSLLGTIQAKRVGSTPKGARLILALLSSPLFSSSLQVPMGTISHSQVREYHPLKRSPGNLFALHQRHLIKTGPLLVLMFENMQHPARGELLTLRRWRFCSLHGYHIPLCIYIPFLKSTFVAPPPNTGPSNVQLF